MIRHRFGGHLRAARMRSLAVTTVTAPYARLADPTEGAASADEERAPSGGVCGSASGRRQGGYDR